MKPNSLILVIDDEPKQLAVIKAILQREGFQVDVTQSAAEALEMVAQSHYAAVVCDEEMPDMNGIEFIRYIRAVRLTVPVVLLTDGKTLEEDEAARAGADAICGKKFVATRLIGIVEALLAAREDHAK